MTLLSCGGEEAGPVGPISRNTYVGRALAGPDAVLSAEMRKSEGLRTDVMTTSTRISRAGWAVALMVAFGLAGCGSSSDSASQADVKNKKAHSHVAIDPSKRSPEDMVAGVTSAKSGPPVELRFDLRGAPQAGQPLDVDIALIPDVATNRVFAKFQAGQGLELVEGGELAAVDKPAAGTPIRHVVRVLPKEDGIYTVSATVTVDLPDDSLTRTYSIPVIVGDGVPDETEKTAALKTH
jgi:hypothetical protein